MIRRGHGIARLKLGTWQPQSCLQLFWDPLTPLLYSSLFRLLTSALLSLVCTLQISQCPLPLYSVTSPAPSLPLGSESACTALLLASLRALSLPSPHPALTLSSLHPHPFSPCPHPVLTPSSPHPAPAPVPIPLAPLEFLVIVLVCFRQGLALYPRLS